MTLIRCTDSIKDCFFQKHMNQIIPGMETEIVPDNDGNDSVTMVLRDETSLMGAVQMGTLEFHSWGSKFNEVEQPDWIIFDLDPDEGMTIETVRKGVRDIKSALDEIGLVSFLKTSGGKGYHVVVPLTPSAKWEQTRGFAKLLAQSMEMKWPDRYTANMRKEKRKGRIYIDWVRNGRSATSVSVYSLRGRKGAPLSWPISWSDLDRITPNQVTLKNYREYMMTIKSWVNFFSIKQKIK
jgi:bifunctional non-homologous end joining protein LigD